MKLSMSLLHRSCNGVRRPITPEKLIPILTVEQTRKLLAACASKTFVDLRDQAIIRLFHNTGGRLSELANLIEDVDLHSETVRFHGKEPKIGACGSARRPYGRSAGTFAPASRRGSGAAAPVARRARRPEYGAGQQCQVAGRLSARDNVRRTLGEDHRAADVRQPGGLIDEDGPPQVRQKSRASVRAGLRQVSPAHITSGVEGSVVPR
jgi:hypothetical protein